MTELGLLGPDGNPIQAFKKGNPPKLGEAFDGRWSYGETWYTTLPGGGILQFDLNRLTLHDFRIMRDHYQVNASLAVLTFMIHQMDWKIVCDNERIRKHCQANMEEIWTKLIGAVSQAYWAGYSPNVLQWENDIAGKSIQLTKVKDLRPEDCLINWKLVEGWAPPGKSKPKIKIYDGIQVHGGGWPIPVDNTFWYPLLMENGDWYGRKLLRPAFTSWFFSILIHLFSNRYFERFGEPIPVGRAPYDDEIDIAGKKVPGTSVMMGVLQNLRNRGVVILPNTKTQTGNDVSFDYTIEYLESQMRGADFERYLMRLDEEISLALFTPLLMLRTADVGSYNLGAQHSQVYAQMLNALGGDLKHYIDSYILGRMVDTNFSPTSPRAKIKFRKLGDDKLTLVTTLLQALISGGKAIPDLDELGEIAGLSVAEVKEVTSSDELDPDSEDPASTDSDEDKDTGGSSNSGAQEAGRVIAAINYRLESQVAKAYRDGTFGASFIPSLGYKRQLEESLRAAGVDPGQAVSIHARLSSWAEDLVSAGMQGFATPEDLLPVLKTGIDNLVKGVLDGA